MDIINKIMDQYIVVDGDLTMTLIRLGVVTLVAFLVGVVVFVPLLTRLISIPVNWCARGIPLSRTEYDGPAIEFITE